MARAHHTLLEAQTLGQEPRPSMVLHQAADGAVISLTQCDQTRGREHSHLAQATTKKLARAASTINHRLRASDDAADRG